MLGLFLILIFNYVYLKTAAGLSPFQTKKRPLLSQQRPLSAPSKNTRHVVMKEAGAKVRIRGFAYQFYAPQLYLMRFV